MYEGAASLNERVLHAVSNGDDALPRSLLLGTQHVWSGWIAGHMPSKSNRHRILTKGRGGAPFIAKSAEAVAYMACVRELVPALPGGPAEGDLGLTADVWYRSRRSDLDIEVLLDALQTTKTYGGIYRNDRQIRMKTLSGHVDKKTPRVWLTIFRFDDWR